MAVLLASGANMLLPIPELRQMGDGPLPGTAHCQSLIGTLFMELSASESYSLLEFGIL